MAEEVTGLIERNLEIMLVTATAVTPVTPAAAAAVTTVETALSIMLWAVVVRLPAIIETSTSSLMVGGGNLPSTGTEALKPTAPRPSVPVSGATGIHRAPTIKSSE